MSKEFGSFYVEEEDEEMGDGPEDLEQAQMMMNMQVIRMNSQTETDRLRKKNEKETHIQNLKRVRNRELMKTGFQIKCCFRNFRPLIYRTFVVPGCLPLYDLCDRVLCPIFGFCRLYHAHYFKKLPFQNGEHELDMGICYGPPEDEKRQPGQFIDLMHARFQNMKLVDGVQVVVCDILKEKGDKMMWVYDLGDQFKFHLTVDLLMEPKSYKKQIYLIDGQGCSLPEDGKGAYRLAEYFFRVEKYKKMKRHDFVKKIREGMNGSCNYQMIGEKFPLDPLNFNLNRCKMVLQISLRSKRKLTSDSDNEGFELPMNTREYKMMKYLMKECRTCKVRDIPMQKCSNCMVAFYCSKECQRSDWVEHKKICRMLVDYISKN